MADDVDNQASAVDQAFEADDVFSLEDIDKLIEDDSPEFMESMTEMQGNEELNQADIEPLHSSSDSIDEEEAEEEKEPELSKIQKILLPIKEKSAPVLKLLDPVKKLKAKVNKKLVLKKIAIKNFLSKKISESGEFVRKGLPERLKYFKKYLGVKASEFIAWVKKFKELRTSQKIILIVSVPSIILVSMLALKTLSGKWVPSLFPQILTSLEPKADGVVDLKGSKAWVELGQAFPQPEFTIEVTKVIFNLMRHEYSGPTPMGTAQVYLNVDSQDTAIEIKDREKEMMVLIRRAGEEFSYEELNSTSGKTRFKSAIKQSISEVLNHGRVKNVYFKYIIVKP